MIACKDGHKDVVHLFLENADRNIDINARNQLGQTAFMYASKNGHKVVVQMVLDNS